MYFVKVAIESSTQYSIESPKGTSQSNQSLKISITVDLKKLDRGQLTYNHAANQFTNVEYNLDADETTIKTALQSTGYICTE